ncbi:DMT family transporter [Desulfobulbus rhabdoformis]|uniref:DMT family transporter n=1 Tax=Desulfobulbus rhabdoformis TaxID=34032 RepID=UPI001F06FD5F|nr:DMT family transporter [Desulfobulbus rhabdoformis]
MQSQQGGEEGEKSSKLQPRPFLGVLLVVVATMFFASMDTTTKYLTMRYNVPMVMAVRYMVQVLLMMTFLAPTQGRSLVQTTRTGLVTLRSFSLVVASLFFGWALQRMPVAESTAIIFLAPILVVLMAGPLLKERIGIMGWLAAGGGFLGVLCIVRPGGGLDALGVACAFMAVAANVTYQLLSRVLAASERTLTMLFHSAIVGAICFGSALPWLLRGETPSHFHILLFLTIGFLGAMAHFCFTLAYRFCSASQVAPVNYMQLVWASLLGWGIFEHMPDGLSMVGMLIIMISGLIIATKARLEERRMEAHLLLKKESVTAGEH